MYIYTFIKKEHLHLYKYMLSVFYQPTKFLNLKKRLLAV